MNGLSPVVETTGKKPSAESVYTCPVEEVETPLIIGGRTEGGGAGHIPPQSFTGGRGGNTPRIFCSLSQHTV